MVQVKATIGTNTYKTTLVANQQTFIADEPIDLGGTDLGPTPKDFLAAALASCTAITVRMYANRKEWLLDDVLVDVTIDTESKPGTTIFRKKIELIGDLDEKTRERLLQIAEKCPVNKILTQPIEI